MITAQERNELELGTTVAKRLVEPQPTLRGSFWRFLGASWSQGAPHMTVAHGHSLALAAPFGPSGSKIFLERVAFEVKDVKIVQSLSEDRKFYWESHLVKIEHEHVYWGMRGIGLDSCRFDFVTGEREKGMMHNISGFVKSLEDAHIVASYFKGRCFIDYRDITPERIQVKVGSHDKEKVNQLYRLVEANQYNLTKEIAHSLMQP